MHCYSPCLDKKIYRKIEYPECYRKIYLLSSETSVFPGPYAVNYVALVGHERVRKAPDRLEDKVWGRCLTPKPIIVVHDQIAFALPLSGHGLDGAADQFVFFEEICALCSFHTTWVPKHSQSR